MRIPLVNPQERKEPMLIRMNYAGKKALGPFPSLSGGSKKRKAKKAASKKSHAKKTSPKKARKAKTRTVVKTVVRTIYKTRRKPMAKKARKPRRLRGKIHRPVVRKFKHRWYRGKGSKLFPRPVRLNARRSRRRRVYHVVRRNPTNPNLKQLVNKQLIMSGVKTGLGIALGFVLMPILYKAAPAQLKAQRKFFGLIYVIGGLAGAGFAKNKHVKDVSATLVAVGIYDLIASLLNNPAMLPAIPDGSSKAANVKASYQIADGEDMTPELAASYEGEIDYGEDVSDIYDLA